MYDPLQHRVASSTAFLEPPHLTAAARSPPGVSLSRAPVGAAILAASFFSRALLSSVGVFIFIPFQRLLLGRSPASSSVVAPHSPAASSFAAAWSKSGSYP